MTIEQLQKQIDELNAKGDALREEIKVLKAQRDKLIGEEQARAKWEAMSDAEKAAMAQYVQLVGASAE